VEDAISRATTGRDYGDLKALLAWPDVQGDGSDPSDANEGQRTRRRFGQEFRSRGANDVLPGTEPVLTFLFIPCRLPGCKTRGNA
jgi:hypothetical protein